MEKRTVSLTLNGATMKVLISHLELIGGNLNQWIATAIYEKLKKEGIHTHDPVKPWGLSK